MNYNSAAFKPDFIRTWQNLFSFMMDAFSSTATLKSSFKERFCSLPTGGTKKRSMTSKHLLLQRQRGVAAAIHVMARGVVVGAAEGGPQ